MRHPLLAAAALVMSTGCNLPTLSQGWQLDRLRILGARAIPAEPRPGEQTSFESILYVPADMTLEGTAWFACLPQSADDFGCTLDTDIDLETADFEDLVEAGFIGFDPDFPPTWTPPEDALDGLDEQQAREGLSAIVNITALPQGAEDDSDLELAYKRVPVSLAETPNSNPELADILIDGAPPATPGEFVTSPGAVHTLEPVLAEGSIETYLYTDSSGATEERIEEPYLTWYTEAGTFDQTFALHPYLDVQWTAPNQPTEALLIVTARDRRGGMAWATLFVHVE